MTDIKKVIDGMLKENTGIHMLDSGFEGGRAWQQNQGKDFEKVPASVLTVDLGRNDLIISKSTYHYLTEFLECTPESERLTQDLKKFADEPENEKYGWLQVMELYFEQRLEPVIKHEGWEAYNISPGVVSNTANYENTINQVLQFMLFPWKEDKPYIMLQIHGGADVRGGYTAPHIFAFSKRHDIDEFYIEDSDYNVNVGDEQWYTDDHGAHWYFEGSSGRSFDTTGFVDHIREFLGISKEDAKDQPDRRFEGDIFGVSIDKETVVGRCHPAAGRRQTTNDKDREDWVNNDEGLYNQFRRSRLSMREFIKQNRAEIDEVINNVRGGKKPAHYLAYGRKAAAPGSMITAVYDNGGKTADRYAVYIDDTEYIGLSDDCNMPNGFSQWGVGSLGPHNGKQIKFSDLPKKVQECVMARLNAAGE